MTTSAWIMLGCTWAIVIGFTTHFFVKVLRLTRSPSAGDPEPPAEADESETPRDEA